MYNDKWIDTTAFKMWCYKVLPAVYDDSLSYYEVLCKMLSNIHDMIENLETMHLNVDELNKNFIELKAWVEGYFESTNFKQQIEDALRKFYQDGTLDQIITNSLKEIYDKITELEAQQLKNTQAISSHNTRITELENMFADFKSSVQVSVTEYGAKGDGVTDDTTAIQNCINANGGKTIFFPSGTYVISKTINVPAVPDKRVNLWFDGGVLKGASSVPTNSAMVRYGSTDFGYVSNDSHKYADSRRPFIYNMCLDGNNAFDHGLLIKNVIGLNVYGCRVANVKKTLYYVGEDDNDRPDYTCTECLFFGCQAIGDQTNKQNIGFRNRKADNYYIDNFVLYCYKGFRDTANAYIDTLHMTFDTDYTDGGDTGLTVECNYGIYKNVYFDTYTWGFYTNINTNAANIILENPIFYNYKNVANQKCIGLDHICPIKIIRPNFWITTNDYIAISFTAKKLNFDLDVAMAARFEVIDPYVIDGKRLTRIDDLIRFKPRGINYWLPDEINHHSVGQYMLVGRVLVHNKYKGESIRVKASGQNNWVSDLKIDFTFTDTPTFNVTGELTGNVIFKGVSICEKSVGFYNANTSFYEIYVKLNTQALPKGYIDTTLCDDYCIPLTTDFTTGVFVSDSISNVVYTKGEK